MERTKKQLAAINSTGNVIVSAGAGSGKTSVLTERIYRRLSKDVNLDEILILTFTDAASKEMKTRIKDELSKNGSTKHLVPLVDSANISTFDAYFLYLCKKYSSRLNISSDIQNIPDDILKIKKYSILEGIFDELYIKKDPQFIKLIHNYTKKDDKYIMDFIIKISDAISDIKNIDEYFNSYYDNYLSNESFEKFIINNIQEVIDNKIESLKHIISHLSNEEYKRKMNVNLSEILDNYSLKYLSENKPKFKLPNRPKDDEEDIERKNEISEIIKFIKENIYSVDYDNLVKVDLKNNQEIIPYIFNIVKKLLNETNKFKSNFGFYTFNDIALMAKRLLIENEDIRLEIKNKLKLIMIDEYQDTSKFQEEFIDLISNNNVFVVGDIKQSIYAFRGANPSQFKDKYDNYKYNKLGQAIDMNDNFRSREEINNDINKLFSEIMTLKQGGADYQLEHLIKTGNKEYTKLKTTNPHGIFVLPFETKKESANDEVEDEKSNNSGVMKKKIEINACLDDVIKRINNKMQVIYSYYNEEGKKKLGLRDATYKDFTFLINKSTDFYLIEEICKERGIPINVVRDEDLISDDVIISLISLLKLINGLMNNDLLISDEKHYFVSVVRSFLYCYSDEDIYKLIKNDTYRKDNVYLNIKEFSTKHKDSLLSEIYLDTIKEFNFLDKVSLLGNSLNKLNYLRIFYERTLIMDKLCYNLEDFITYLERLNDLEIKMTNRKVGEAKDAITLTTIHKSKGLEYNIVYLPLLFAKSQPQEKDHSFFINAKYGFYLPSLYNSKNKTLHELFYNEYDNRNAYDEKIRLLYVALTRAKEEVIIPLSDENSKAMDDLFDVDIRKRIENSQTLGEIMFASKDISFEKSYYLNMPLKTKKSDNTNNHNNNDKQIIIEEFNNYTYKTKKSFKASKDLDLGVSLKTLNYGTHIHLLMEEVDFTNKDTKFIRNNREKIMIDKVLKNDIFNNLDQAKIYKEYQFINDEYNIVIDLMIEHQDYIDIIDYKLKNVSDEEYKEQLNTYRKIIFSLFKKKVKCYLLSIMDNDLKEVYE